MSTALLLTAGVIGGVIGTAGGIASLVAYPALLAAGLAPVQANIANTVALISGAVAASVASRRELRTHRRGLPGWAAPAAAGGTAGAVLLLVTPADVFAWIVPLLVAFAAVLILVRPFAGSPPTSGRPTRPDSRAWPAAVFAAVFAVGVYSGYFGAGAGILTLAAVLHLVDAELVRANAVKNALTACAGVLPAVVFALVADVAWWTVVPLAAGTAIGGAVGPAVTRRLDPRVLRAIAALMGFTLAAWLALRAAR
ncbi:sulfite exporter TauE/SafE family protein [Dactylosporangium sp. NPDC000521]|uniref:sulfite exporter TauE/SafE family protein n=1 Tax=Dactylosporangium sp. NPDC000521 TaxID=3363975 RepID=UPI0036B17646